LKNSQVIKKEGAEMSPLVNCSYIITKKPTNVGLDVDLFLRIENRGNIFTPISFFPKKDATIYPVL